jgi:hypothetical protein
MPPVTPEKRTDAPNHDVFHGILRMAEVFSRALTDILKPFRLALSQ